MTPHIRWMHVLLAVAALGLTGCKDLKIHSNKRSVRYGQPVKLWLTYKGDLVPHDAPVTWSSNRDGPIGTGGHAVFSELSPGKHKITARGSYRGETVKIGPKKISVVNDKPTVRIIQPSASWTIGVGEAIPLSGTASDTEDGPLFGGKLRWYVNGRSVGSGRNTPLRNTFRPGPLKIALEATDRAGAKSRREVTVHITNRSPRVSIERPSNHARLRVGGTVRLAGHATDPDPLSGPAQIPSHQLEWRSDTQGRLGTGTVLAVSNLQGGKHRITLRARDEFGGTGTASIDVEVVNAKPDVTVVQPISGRRFMVTDRIRFEADVVDPDGYSVSNKKIVWRSSKDGQIGTGRSIETDKLSPGTHSITCSATDKHGATGRSSAVRVVLENAAPVARITSPRNGKRVQFGEKVVLRGRAQDAEDGELAGGRLRWSYRAQGSSQAQTLGYGRGLNTSTLPFGTNTIFLRAQDRDGTWSQQVSIRVTVLNRAPQANISSPRANARFMQGAAITFTGTGFDKDRNRWLTGNQLVWTARRGSSNQTIGRGRSFSVDNLAVGTWEVTLTAVDPDDSSLKETQTVSIQITRNQRPRVTIISPQANATSRPGGRLQLTGSAFDPDRNSWLNGAALTWTARQGNGAPRTLGQGRSLRVANLPAGSWQITLSATDPDSARLKGTARVRYQVIQPNRPPVAKITYPQDGARFPRNATINARGQAKDPEDGTLLSQSLTWTIQREGTLGTPRNLGTGLRARLPLLRPGAYRLRLTAQDTSNQNGVASIRVIIQGGPVPPQPTPNNQPPVVTITSHQAGGIYRAGRQTFRGSAVDPDRNNAPVPSVHLEWHITKLGNGGAWSTTKRGSIARVYLAPGRYRVQLVASDPADPSLKGQTRFRIRVQNSVNGVVGGLNNGTGNP